MKQPHLSEFTINEGETVAFSLTYGTFGDYHEDSLHENVDVNKAYQDTAAFWHRWASRCSYENALLQESLLQTRQRV